MRTGPPLLFEQKSLDPTVVGSLLMCLGLNLTVEQKDHTATLITSSIGIYSYKTKKPKEPLTRAP